MSEASEEHRDIKRLEQEGDIAADYLEELLDIADIDGDIDISVDNTRATVGILTDEKMDERLRRLIGKRGMTLNSLQDLTRLAVQQKTGERSRLMLDIGGYRGERRTKIEALAQEAIREVKETGDEIELEAMNPFERKIVHDAATVAGLVSDSEGYGSERHVVIKPVDNNKDDE
ncbi:protein jag [Actinotignum urinale]|uniref:Jag family protein n=1 Tax=Actinotignum urinale TaxID=190146 RepID=UPI00370D049F